MTENESNADFTKAINRLIQSVAIAKDTSIEAYYQSLLRLILVHRSRILPETRFVALLELLASGINTFLAHQFYQAAEKLCNDALDLLKQQKLNPPAYTAWHKTILGLLIDIAKAQQSEVEQAEVNFKKALIDALEGGYQEIQLNALLGLCEYYLKIGSLVESLTFGHTALRLAQQNAMPDLTITDIEWRFKVAQSYFIYQYLPKTDTYEDGVWVKQICEANRISPAAVKALYETLLSAAYYLAKAKAWDKAYHTVNCLMAWVGKGWGLEALLIEAPTILLSVIVERNDAALEAYTPSQSFHEWGEQKNALKAIRDALKTNITDRTSDDTQVLLQGFNQAIRQFLINLFKQCETLLGAPPNACQYVILGLGSLARQEFCPYSDVEYAILVDQETPAVKAYFEALEYCIAIQIVLLGETPPKDILIPYFKKGLSLDEGGHVPFHCKILFGDSQTLLTNVAFQRGTVAFADPIIVNALQEACFLYGDKALYQAFNQQLKARLSEIAKGDTRPRRERLALQLYQINPLVINDDMGSCVQLKNELLRPLVLTLIYLSLAYGISETTSLGRLAALTRLGHIEESIGNTFKYALLLLLKWRMEAHLHYGYEEDKVYLPKAGVDSFCLTDAQVDALKTVKEGLLLPLKEEIAQFVEGNLINPTLILTPCLQQKSLFTSLVSFYHYLAQESSKLKQHSKTVKWYREALGLNPNDLAVKDLLKLALAQETKETQLLTAIQHSLNLLSTAVVPASRTSFQRDEEMWKASFQGPPTYPAFRLDWLTPEDIKAYHHHPVLSFTSIIGLVLLAKLSDSLVDKYFCKKVYRQLFQMLALEVRREALAIIIAYETDALMREFLTQQLLTIELPDNPSGERSSFIAQKPEEALIHELSFLFEPYDPQRIQDYRTEKRMYVRFSFKGQVKTYLLKSTYQNQWINAHYFFKEDLRSQEDGRRIVIPVKEGNREVAYAKVYPEMPGIQASVDQLLQRLSGFYVPSMLCQFSNFEEKSQTYPVLFSQAVPGKSLKQMLRAGQSLSSLEPLLDPYHFTWRVIETLLFHYEDDKADNIIAVPFSDTDGKTRYRLISIDNDHAYVDALISRGLFSKEVKLQLKTLVFCFKTMRDPLNEEAVNLFKQLRWEEVLEQWLTQVDNINTAWIGEFDALQKTHEGNGLFKDIKGYFDAKPDSTLIPCVFEPGTIQAIAQRFWRLQALLRSQKHYSTTHLDLVRYIHPHLARFYAEVLQDNRYQSPEARFEALPTDYIVIKDKQNFVHHQSDFDMRKRYEASLTLADEKKKRDIQSAMANDAIYTPKKALEAELKGTLQYFHQMAFIREGLLKEDRESLQAFEKVSPYIKEQILKRLNFSHLSDTMTNKILEKLSGITLQELNLQHCTLLTNTRLKNLLSAMLTLRVLNLEGCIQIGVKLDLTEKMNLTSNDLFTEILTLCPYLEKINLSQTNIGFIAYTKPHRLNRLTLVSCPLLHRISFNHAFEAIALNVSDSNNLFTIELTARYINRLQYHGCQALHSIHLHTSQNLVVLMQNLSGEPHVSIQVNGEILPLNNKLAMAAYFNKQAMKKFEQKQYEAAIKDYDEAIQLAPNNADYFSLRGKTKYQLKRYKEAIVDYDEAIKLNSKDADYFNNRGKIKYQLKCYKEAIVDYDEVIKLNRKSADYFELRGKAKRDLNRYEEAIVDHDEATRLKPDYAVAFYNRGNAKANLGHYAEAIKDFDEAIRLKPDYAVAFYNRGVAKRNLGQYDNAIKDYDQANRLKPDLAVAFYNRGNVKTNLGHYAEAIKDFDEAIRLKPDYAEAFYNSGVAKKNLGQYKDAIKDYDEAININSNNAVYFNNRGSVKAALNRYKEAIVDLDEAISLDPNNAVYFNNRGLSKSALNRYEEAIVDYDEAIKLAPNNAVYFNNRVNAKLSLKQYDAAIEDSDDALQLMPTNAFALKNKAFAYLFKKALALAKENFIFVLNLKQEDQDTKRMQCYSNIGLTFIDWLEGKSQSLVTAVFYETYQQLDLSFRKAYLTSECLAAFFLRVVEEGWMKAYPDTLKSAYREVLGIIHQVVIDCPQEVSPHFYRAQLLLLSHQSDEAKQELMQCLVLSPKAEGITTLLAKCDHPAKIVLFNEDTSDLITVPVIGNTDKAVMNAKEDRKNNDENNIKSMFTEQWLNQESDVTSIEQPYPLTQNEFRIRAVLPTSPNIVLPTITTEITEARPLTTEKTAGLQVHGLFAESASAKTNDQTLSLSQEELQPNYAKILSEEEYLLYEAANKK